MEITEEKYISWHDAKKIMDKKFKEGEPGYEQKNALEHLKKFSKLTDKDAKAMQEELEKMGKLRDRQVIAIMNMMPKDMDELRVLFANEIVSVTEDQKKEILSIVKKYA
jgi:DNA-directed RNA polymerase subunit F